MFTTFQTVESLSPALAVIDTLPAPVQDIVRGECAKLWAAHFQAEAEAALEAQRKAYYAFSDRHKAMPQGPKYHGGKCMHCGCSLPRWKSFAHFDTEARKLTCHLCLSEREGALFRACLTSGAIVSR